MPFVAGLPMYDWPEVADALDALWTHIATDAHRLGLGAPASLTRRDDLVSLWTDPSMLLGQVCSLNPVRDGLGETEVVGTLVYDPPPDLPQPEPGSYYSVLVCRADDPRRPTAGLGVGAGTARPDVLRFAGARVAANGTDSQSGYWSLGHFVRDLLDDGPIFGDVVFTGAHRDSVRAVADGTVDLAAIDVHSWRLACEYEPRADRTAGRDRDHRPDPGGRLRRVVGAQGAPRRPRSGPARRRVTLRRDTRRVAPAHQRLPIPATRGVPGGRRSGRGRRASPLARTLICGQDSRWEITASSARR